MGRYDILRRIGQLDAEKDHVAIYELMTYYEFPWDITRALEVALYRTYCVPSISALLQKTGEFTYAESNQRIGEATRDLFLSCFPVPQFVRNLLKPSIYALLDDSMLHAFGFPHPPGWLRQLLASLLKARAYALRFFPTRKKPFIYAQDLKHRSYPHGYHLSDVGPYSLLPLLNRTNSQ